MTPEQRITLLEAALLSLLDRQLALECKLQQQEAALKLMGMAQQGIADLRARLDRLEMQQRKHQPQAPRPRVAI